MAELVLPKLYVIVDPEELQRRTIAMREFAENLRAGGVDLVQLRDKSGSPHAILDRAAVLKTVFDDSDCRLIMNDRADLAVLAELDGVHVGQEDLSVADARRVLECGAAGDMDWKKLVGVSTHTGEQVRLAELTGADYIAIGPVFATGTKLNAAPVVGLEGVRWARQLTDKPLVAIGGITRQNAASVMAAGADCCAVISGLFVPGETVEKVARDFLDIFR